MTEEQVIALIRKEQGKKSIRKFASEIGVSAGYLSDVYQNRLSPGKSILDYFEIDKRKKVIVQHVFIRRAKKC